MSQCRRKARSGMVVHDEKHSAGPGKRKSSLSQPRLRSETLSKKGVHIRAANISKPQAYQVNTNSRLNCRFQCGKEWRLNRGGLET